MWLALLAAGGCASSEPRQPGCHEAAAEHRGLECKDVFFRPWEHSATVAWVEDLDSGRLDEVELEGPTAVVAWVLEERFLIAIHQGALWPDPSELVLAFPVEAHRSLDALDSSEPVTGDGTDCMIDCGDPDWNERELVLVDWLPVALSVSSTLPLSPAGLEVTTTTLTELDGVAPAFFEPLDERDLVTSELRAFERSAIYHVTGEPDACPPPLPPSCEALLAVRHRYRALAER